MLRGACRTACRHGSGGVHELRQHCRVLHRNSGSGGSCVLEERVIGVVGHTDGTLVGEMVLIHGHQVGHVLHRLLMVLVRLLLGLLCGCVGHG